MEKANKTRLYAVHVQPLHCPIQKWGASVLRGSPYGENCVGDAAALGFTRSDKRGSDSEQRFHLLGEIKYKTSRELRKAALRISHLKELDLCAIGAPVPSKAGPSWTDSPYFYMGQQGATKKMDWTAHLLLVYVWDKTPSGTARSIVLYKSEEHQFCGAFLTERTVCGMQQPLALQGLIKGAQIQSKVSIS